MIQKKARMFKYLFLLFLFLGCHLSQSQHAPSPFIGIPPMHIYTADDFGTNSQAWATMQDENGLIFVATSAGIKCFDGERWSLISENYIQAFCKIKSRIYAGGFSSMGFIEVQNGSIQFQSLAHLLPAEIEYTVIRNIHNVGGNIYFVSHEHIFIYNEKSQKMSVISSDEMLYPSQVVGNQLIITVNGRGLFTIKNEALVQIPHGEKWATKQVSRIESVNDNSFITLSSIDGIDYFQGQSVLHTSYFDHPYYKSNNLFHSTQLKNGHYALSFLSGGFVMTDSLFQPLLVLDQSTGISNQVHHVYQDLQGDLWIATNEGLVYVNLSSQLTFAGKKNGIEGTVFSSLRLGNDYYVASGSGVYYKGLDKKTDLLDPQERGFKKVKNSNSRALSLINAGGSLFSAQNETKGTIVDHEYFSLLEHSNAYHATAIYDPDREIIIANNIDGQHIEVFTKVNNRWKHLHTIHEERLPIHLMIFGVYDPNLKCYWADPPFDEPTYRFKLNDQLDGIEELTFLSEEDLPLGQVNFLTLEDKISFATTAGLYQYDMDHKRMVKDHRFGNHFDSIGLIALLKLSENKYWYQSSDLQQRGLVSINPATSKVTIDNEMLSGLSLGSSTPYMARISQSAIGMGSLNGLQIIRLDQEKESFEFKYSPTIRRVRIIQADSVIHFGHFVNQAGATINNQQHIVTLPAHQNSLEFSFAAPFFKGCKTLSYRTQLVGYDEQWSPWSEADQAVYTNIPHGNFVFSVQTKNAFGKISTIGTYQFSISPVWYHSYAAYFVYFILLIGVIYIIVKINARKLIVENEQLEGIIRARVKEIEDQKNIISQSLSEKESLLKEIHHRVKNNLQIIANLLYLQSNKFDDEKIKNVLEEGQGRVRSMALIHQKLYENDDLKSIPFGEYVLELVNEIKVSFGEQAANVKIKVDAEEAFFDVDNAVPLGLIINELSTNAFKYAFEGKDEGQFSIFLTKSENEYELHITDNGKGIPDEIDIRKTRSLGLRLVRILSEQLEGDYSFESNNGMSFKLKFVA